MKKVTASGLRRGLLLLAITVALAATGFGHRLVTTDAPTLAFLAATGGTGADLCGDSPVDGGAGNASGGLTCLACHILGSPDLPASGVAIRLGLATGGAWQAAGQSRAVARIFDPAHAPQGPPRA